MEALKDLTFTIDRASFVSFIGPSGSGKTTLLNLIGALDRPTSGRLLVSDTEVGTLDRPAAATFRGQTIGFIFQEFNLMPVLTAYENVEYPLLLVERIPLSYHRRRGRHSGPVGDLRIHHGSRLEDRDPRPEVWPLVRCPKRRPAGSDSGGRPLHNFIGGLAIGASFIVSTEVGIITWIAAAAHEIPQELGDFGILIRGGWGRLQALVANFLSAATILPGALLAYYLSADFNITFLLSFAAGNFLYIAASDLIPEVKHRLLRNNLVHFVAFVSGVSVILLTRAMFHA